MRRPSLSLAAVPGRRRKTLDLAKEIEDRGFAGLYCPSFGDGLGLCNALAQATSTITFGTGIANIYARNVIDYAQTAAFIHEVSDQRFRFGVGVSHAPSNKRLGVNPGKPLGDMADFVAELRGQERIGELPPLVLAAMRDKMLALAGELGDGAIYANAARSALSAQLARRPEPRVGDEFWMGCMIPTCISDDREAAAAINRRTLSGYVRLPNYRNYWKAEGYANEMEAIENAFERGDRDAVPGLMTDDWLADVTLFGSEDDVLAGIERWWETGVEPILVPSSVNGGQMTAFDEVFAMFDRFG